MKNTITVEVREILFVFVMTLVITFAAGSIAHAAPFKVPAHTGYVTDTARMLTEDQRHGIDMQLQAYEKNTTNEVAVLIVRDLQGLSIEEYANKTFHEWGIGKKGKDNGVLLLWSTDERKVRIEVGYGLEPILNDGKAGEIIRTFITPNFKAQRWYEGVSEGTNTIMRRLTPETFPVHAVTSDGDSAIVAAALIFWLVVAILVILIIIVVADALFGNGYSTSGSGSYYSSDSGSSWGSSSSSDSGGFGGGDSGGGGASGSY